MRVYMVVFFVSQSQFSSPLLVSCCSYFVSCCITVPFPFHLRQSLQHAMANRQANSADLLKAEQESQQMAQYMKQQQLEYQEALQSLQKKVGLVDEVQKENLKIHQLNVTLTGELEDYRHQTKSLIADLNQKDEEIARLQEARSHSLSSDVSDDCGPSVVTPVVIVVKARVCTYIESQSMKSKNTVCRMYICVHVYIQCHVYICIYMYMYIWMCIYIR